MALVTSITLADQLERMVGNGVAQRPLSKVCEAGFAGAAPHLLLLPLLLVQLLPLLVVGLPQLLDAVLEPVPVPFAGDPQLLEDGAVQLQQLLTAHLNQFFFFF